MCTTKYSTGYFMLYLKQVGVKPESETVYLLNLTEYLDLNPDLGDFKIHNVFDLTMLLLSKLSRGSSSLYYFSVLQC